MAGKDIPVAEVPGPNGTGPKSPRKMMLVTVGCGLMALAGVGVLQVVNPAFGAPSDALDVSASKPRLDANGLAGTFRLFHSPSGLQSNHTGGACFVADMSKMPATDPGYSDIHHGTCTSDAECSPNGQQQPWTGYCVPDHGANGVGQCWYRPPTASLAEEEQLCEKSGYYADPQKNIPPKTWVVGAHNKTPHSPGFDVNAFYRDHDGGKSTRWRIIGRVNGVNGDYRLRYGNPACLPEGTCS